jgi:hypothetical protein
MSFNSKTQKHRIQHNPNVFAAAADGQQSGKQADSG